MLELPKLYRVPGLSGLYGVSGCQGYLDIRVSGLHIYACHVYLGVSGGIWVFCIPGNGGVPVARCICGRQAKLMDIHGWIFSIILPGRRH